MPGIIKLIDSVNLKRWRIRVHKRMLPRRQTIENKYSQTNVSQNCRKRPQPKGQTMENKHSQTNVSKNWPQEIPAKKTNDGE
jgi:hypothetical protein